MDSEIIKIKTNCSICDGAIKDFFLIKNMPLFMGSMDLPLHESFHNDMTFCECEKCGCIQIKELVNNSILYQNNHNSSIVGDLWVNHYVELSSFIKEGIKNKRVIEIADPSCKISKYISNDSICWDIVEFNPDNDINLPKVNFIKEWFDENFECKKYDVIIHSHFFEHLFNPLKGLKKMNECLDIGGKMYFSVPNLSKILLNGFMPSNVLQFEHTFFYDIDDLKSILNKIGFKVNMVYEYKEHSIFFECTKQTEPDENVNNIIMGSNKYKNLFLENYQSIKNSIDKFNKIDNSEKYVFGCHVSTQSIISMDLNLSNVKFLLDNSPKKNHKFLYGTKIMAEYPNLIENVKTPVVFVSHTGVYKKEISNQLKSINSNVILI